MKQAPIFAEFWSSLFAKAQVTYLTFILLILQTLTMPAKKFWSLSVNSKKKKCNPYFIVIMITVLIMNVIFWVVNFKTQNYFVISTTQNVYLRLSMYDCANFVYSCRIFGISELQNRIKRAIAYF
jgi:hypothetical protein